MKKGNLCLMCEESLNQEGKCPKGCTEQTGYGEMAGIHYDKRDVKIKSLSSGFCLDCGAPVTCEKGCYDNVLYDDGFKSNAALDEGVCLRCGGKVDCPDKHLS